MGQTALLVKLVTENKDCEKTVNGFIAFGPIPVGRGAASCRPRRSWPLGRRSGRVAALPYPPPRLAQCNPEGYDRANSFSFFLELARRLASAQEAGTRCGTSDCGKALIQDSKPVDGSPWILYKSLAFDTRLIHESRAHVEHRSAIMPTATDCTLDAPSFLRGQSTQAGVTAWKCQLRSN